MVVGPGKSQFDILRIAASDAVHYGKGTEDLITVRAGWNREFGIDVYAAQMAPFNSNFDQCPKNSSSSPKRSIRFASISKDIVSKRRKRGSSRFDHIPRTGLTLF